MSEQHTLIPSFIGEDALNELLQSQAPGVPAQADEPTLGFLCFSLGDEEFAVKLNLVQQIVVPPPVTWVPRVKPHFLGVISIRGGVVTLVDTRLLIGLEPSSWPKNARILLMNNDGEQMGLLVDGVTQVRRVKSSAFEANPQLDDSSRMEHVAGIARPDEDTQITVIDLDQILSEVLR